MEQKKCSFCNVVKDNSRVYIMESANTITLHSHPYQVEGHLLVIPKEHYESLIEMPYDLLHELLDEIVRAKSLLLCKGAEGITIKQNYFPFLPESEVKVDHVHFHVVPRYNKDEIYQKVLIHEGDVWKKATEEELKKLAGKFRT